MVSRLIETSGVKDNFLLDYTDHVKAFRRIKITVFKERRSTEGALWMIMVYEFNLMDQR